MKQTRTALWRAIILASMMMASPGTSIASTAIGSTKEAPRPENYASYSLYIQALFDYQKAQSKEADTAAEKLCTEATGDEHRDALKKNICQVKAVTINNSGEPGNEPYESLEEAISKNPAIANLTDSSNSASARSTFRSFPLNPIAAQDMSQMGVAGLLGLFNSLVLQSQTNASANQQINSITTPSTNIDPTVSNDLYSLLFTQIIDETLAMGGNIVLRDGRADTDLSATIVGNGLQLQVSSDVRTGFYIVDRDGHPENGFAGAGALVVNSLGINVDNLLVNIQGVNRNSANPDLLGIQVNSPNAITIDLSGTTIGVADALRDGSQIGTPTNFLSFGPNSVLTIAPGMSLHTALTRPNGTTTPLLTLNGNIGSISLRDISILDNDDGGALRIGRLGIDGIQLVNTQIFIDGQKIIIDAGTGIRNASLILDRVAIGDSINGSMIGNFALRNINLVSTRMSIEPH